MPPVSNAPPAILGVSELAYWVVDLDRSVEFYRDHLGFEVTDVQPNQNAVLRSGSLTLVLFSTRSPGAPLAEEYLQRHAGPAGDVYHAGFRVDPAKLDEFALRLRERGLETRGPIAFQSGRRSYFVEDPDAHCIELTDM